VLKRKAVLSLLVILCLITSGCAAIVVGAAAGGAAVGYYKGWLVDQIPTTVPKAFEATKAGLKELNLPVYKGRYDQIKGTVDSELADGTNVYVKLRATEGGTTEIKIRVGTIGDKDASHRILKAIKKHI
jgi:uncharacterized protein YceK